MLLGIVERYTLDKMGVRIGDGSHVEQRRPQGTVRRHEHGSILDLLRQGQELLTEGVRRPKVGAYIIIMPQATQHGEKLGRIVQVLTEVPSTRVGLTKFHRRSPLRGTQGGAERDQQVHFMLKTLRCLQ